MKYKDPVTGEWKTLSVKAADTLPIGTIVDYDGDTVPDGWEEVEDNDNLKIQVISATINVEDTEVHTVPIDYSEIPGGINRVKGSVITSFANSWDNGKIESYVPTPYSANKNIINSVYIKHRSNGVGSKTIIYVLVFYR